MDGCFQNAIITLRPYVRWVELVDVTRSKISEIIALLRAIVGCCSKSCVVVINNCSPAPLVKMVYYAARSFGMALGRNRNGGRK